MQTGREGGKDGSRKGGRAGADGMIERQNLYTCKCAYMHHCVPTLSRMYTFFCAQRESARERETHRRTDEYIDRQRE